MNKYILLISAAFLLFINGCGNLSANCPVLDLNPEYTVPPSELGLPCGSVGTVDAGSGVGLYYYDVQDPSNTAYAKEYIVDKNKLLATIDLKYEEVLKLGVVDPDKLYLMRRNGLYWGSNEGYYVIDRKDGAIMSGVVNGIYWDSTPDKQYAVFTQNDPSIGNGSENVLVSNFNNENDEVYILPDITSISGNFSTSALSISEDGNFIALVVQDQIKQETDSSKYYGVLFLINRKDNVVTNVGSLTETPQEGPYMPFSDGTFTWDDNNQVAFTIGDQILSSDRSLTTDDSAIDAEISETLISFFDALSTGQFENAVEFFDFEGYGPWVYSTSDDPAQILEDYCAATGTCLRAEVLATNQVNEDEYALTVQFFNADGSIYIFGPCCGASEEEMPSEDTFEFTVKNIDGIFKVTTAPLYRP